MRAHRHAELLVAAIKFKSLDLMPPSDARALALLDSLTWSIRDDDKLMSGEPLEVNALRARFGDSEVAVRMKFLDCEMSDESPLAAAEVAAANAEAADGHSDV